MRDETRAYQLAHQDSQVRGNGHHAGTELVVQLAAVLRQGDDLIAQRGDVQHILPEISVPIDTKAASLSDDSASSSKNSEKSMSAALSRVPIVFAALAYCTLSPTILVILGNASRTIPVRASRRC